MVCRYKYCKHENKEITDNEQSIQSGRSYFHIDCYNEKDNIEKILSLFCEKINKNCVFAQLRSVVNNIVYTKQVSAEYLLFALQYYIEHKIPLNYPQGLYYVIQNKETKQAYDKLKSKNIKQKMKESVDDEMTLESDFSYKVTKGKTVGDIFDE